MAVPALISKALPGLLNQARSLATTVFSSNAGVAAKAAIRTGIQGGPTRILNAMKNNKVTTALVLMELGEAGTELLNAMTEADADVRELVERYSFTNDPVETETRGDLATQMDEMQTITRAARAVGGLSNLHALRRALQLSSDHYKLYDELKVMTAVL